MQKFADRPPLSFGTIRNNTALKLQNGVRVTNKGFGTIRNNTALKLVIISYYYISSFGTIRNNTALKQLQCKQRFKLCFGTIRNNTALKPRGPFFSRNFVIAPFVSARLQLRNNSFYLFSKPEGDFAFN